MTTLAEIDAAVQALPRPEQETLYARLRERLQGGVTIEDRLKALTLLQKSLALDDEKVAAWQAAVRDARS